MAVHRTRSHGRRSKRSKKRFIQFRLVLSSRIRRHLRPLLTGLLLVALIAAAYLVLPGSLLWQWQLIWGLAWAVGAVSIYAVATRQNELSEQEMLLRIRRGQHADFGRRLRKAQEHHATIKLPLVGETSYRALGGAGLLVLMGSWWFGPLAPVEAVVPKVDVVEDVTGLLTDEIVAVVLVMSDANVAVLQPPVQPSTVRRLAREIEAEAPAYERGLRATALNHCEEARALLTGAAQEAILENGGQLQAIRVALAQNAMYAGEFAEATSRYRQAVQQAPDDPMLACQMGLAQMHAGRFDDAAAPISRAVEICREKSLGKEEGDPVLAACLHVQAALRVCLGKEYDEAVLTCLRSRKEFKKAVEGQHPLEAASLNNQAVIYLLQGKYPGAEGLSLTAGDVWTSTLGRHDPRVAASLGNLGMLRCNLGRYAEAEEPLQRALAIRGRTVPETHPILALGRNTCAGLYVALARYDEARPLVERALDTCEKSLGPEHPDMAPILGTLAALYAEQAQYVKAERYYLRAVAVAEESWGPDHPYLAGTLNRLAALYLRQGRCGKAEAYEKVEEVCQRAIDIATQAFGRGHPLVAAALNTRGRLEIDRGQLRNARPYLEEALAISQRAFGEEHPEVARTMANLATLENSPRTAAKGIAQYKRAIEIMRDRLGSRHPEVARLLCGQAELYMAQGKLSEADQCLQRALVIQQEKLLSYHPDLAATLELMASLLRKSTPPEEDRAAEIARRARSIRADHAAEDRPD